MKRERTESRMFADLAYYITSTAYYNNGIDEENFCIVFDRLLKKISFLWQKIQWQSCKVEDTRDIYV